MNKERSLPLEIVPGHHLATQEKMVAAAAMHFLLQTASSLPFLAQVQKGDQTSDAKQWPFAT